MAPERDTAEYGRMPQIAIFTGLIDYILVPERKQADELRRESNQRISRVLESISVTFVRPF